MFKAGEYIIYNNNVCRIKEIRNKEFYVMNPVDDESLTITLPVDNNSIKEVMNKKEALNLIDNILDVEVLDIDGKLLEKEYKKLIKSDDIYDKIKIIKTSYMRNIIRENNGKKLSETDNNYLNKAEKVVYNELAISLNKSFDETKEFIMNTLKEKSE